MCGVCERVFAWSVYNGHAGVKACTSKFVCLVYFLSHFLYIERTSTDVMVCARGSNDKRTLTHSQNSSYTVSQHQTAHSKTAANWEFIECSL